MISAFFTHFLRIFMEAAPFLFAGTLASGLIEVFVSRDDITRFMPRNPVLASLVGSLMGFALPVGECGVVPVVRQLHRKGFPASASIAFLLAAPIVNPIVIASTVAAFHEHTAAIVYWRIGIALIVAISMGSLFSFQPHLLRRADPKPETALSSTLIPSSRSALLLALLEFLNLVRYLIIGSLLAAGTQVIITQNYLEGLATNQVNSVFVMQALALIRSIGSVTDASVASDLVGTFAPGSILAFLTFGPLVDIKNITLLLGVFHKRVVLYLILLPFLMIALITIWLNLNIRF